MVWTVKISETTDKEIKIAYSCEDNLSMDGLIVYEKKSKKYEVTKLSQGATETQCKKTIQFLKMIMGTSKLSEKPYRICTG